MSDRIAVMAMYPFPALQPSWQALYAAVSAEIDATPELLRWDLDPHDTWLDPELVLGMTCGWPLVTALHDGVRVVGTFAYDGGDGPSHRYRTVIVARRAAPLEQFVGTRAAINSDDSLSGNISLLDAFDAGTVWPGERVMTGAHLLSIDAVRTGAADVASIDGQTWAYQQRDDPERLAGLSVIGNGPVVPCLPVILPGDASDAEVTLWRDAIASAVEHPTLRDDMHRLMIHHFVPLDLSDYVEALAPLLAQHRD